MQSKDQVFAGSIPTIYQTILVPLIFQHYAQDIVRRIIARPLDRILEIAAGTGVVTRALCEALPERTKIVATDLNPAMLEEARRAGTSRAVEWQVADAMHLPFEDGEFDAIVCQFGAMFFPDKAAAFAEARRVLKPGGLFLFNVWDRIADNHFAETVTDSLGQRYPDSPPLFLARTPHGYHGHAVIERDLRAAGFTKVQIDTVSTRSKASSPDVVAKAYCQGTPLRGEIEARDPSGLDAATDAAREALIQRFGHGAIGGKIQALVISASS